MFKTGDKVRFLNLTKGIIKDWGHNGFCIEGDIKVNNSYYTDFATIEAVLPNREYSVSYTDDKGKKVQLSFKEKDLILISPTMSTLQERIAGLFVTEPQKTNQKAGIVDARNQLTPEGKDAYLNWLFQKDADTFKNEVSNLLIALEETK